MANHFNNNNNNNNRFFLVLQQIVVVVLIATMYDLYNHKWYPTEICLAVSDGNGDGNGEEIEGKDSGSITLQYQLPRMSNTSSRRSSSSSSRSRNITWTDPCRRLFSTEYVEARTKFRNAVSMYHNSNNEKREARLYTLPILNMGGKEEFTIDVAVFPGSSSGSSNSKKTIFHSSGVHGVEGFVGSAIQLALLQKGVLPFLDDENDKNDDIERPNLVLIHAVNPVGMHQHRRFNEQNVDLNRNCLINNYAEDDNGDDVSGEQQEQELIRKRQKQKQYFDNFVANRDPNIANYEDFRDFLAPTGGDEDDDYKNKNNNNGQQYPTAFYQHIGIWLRVLPKLIQHGYTHLKRSMVSGQYHDPKGLFFGGQELQPSITQLIHFLNTIRPDLFYGSLDTSSTSDADGENTAESTATPSSSSSVVWIDVHSGLGPFGKDSLHCEVGNAGVADPDGVEIDINAIFPTAYRSTVGMDADKHDESSAFSGYDLTKGGMTTMLKQMWESQYQKRKQQQQQQQQKGLFVVQEFGTMPGILVGRSLILDNMLYQYRTNDSNDDKNSNIPDLSYRSPWLRYAFYPQSAEWRKSVIKRGVSLVLDAINFVET